MADYAIGDIQGCYDVFMKLLHHIKFDEKQDTLWFVGDLVNRGPKSLQVLRFIKALPKTHIVLGNHDLHLLARIYNNKGKVNHDDTLREVEEAPDREELAEWLRSQKILHYDDEANIVMVHAGIAPIWDLKEAIQYAKELETVIHGPHYKYYFANLYGNESSFNNDLKGLERWRVICNYFTRMRFCDKFGHLDFKYKGKIKDAPVNLYPWYAVPGRKFIETSVVFGHWAALEGQALGPNLYAIDTGCLWGGALTALRLHDKRRFMI